MGREWFMARPIRTSFRMPEWVTVGDLVIFGADITTAVNEVNKSRAAFRGFSFLAGYAA
jgi:hypothetical protein